jgi:transcription elongation factor Elf1
MKRKMKRKKEIIAKLKEIKSLITCPKCGDIAALDVDGKAACLKCSLLKDKYVYVKGTWIDIGIYYALLWVLGKKVDYFRFEKSK